MAVTLELVVDMGLTLCVWHVIISGRAGHEMLELQCPIMKRRCQIKEAGVEKYTLSELNIRSSSLAVKLRQRQWQKKWKDHQEFIIYLAFSKADLFFPTI